MIKFTVPGIPVAKARPKFAVRGGFARAYTPAKTAAYEKLVAQYGRITISEPLNGPLSIDLAFTLPIPASTSKKLAVALLNGPHTKKPDLDNMIKSITDALNGIAYRDDSQLWRITASKIYGMAPGVAINISEIDN